MIHKDLKAWQESMDLVVIIYKLTSKFPDEEKYGLTSQLRRASVSIPSNIAEGSARKGNKEFLQFLYIALGSLAELDTQLEIAQRLEFMQSFTEMESRTKFIRNLIIGLIRKLKS